MFTLIRNRTLATDINMYCLTKNITNKSNKLTGKNATKAVVHHLIINDLFVRIVDARAYFTNGNTRESGR